MWGTNAKWSRGDVCLQCVCVCATVGEGKECRVRAEVIPTGEKK